jgi:hypothetical protein
VPPLPCQQFLQKPDHDPAVPTQHVVTNGLHQQALLSVQQRVPVHLLYDGQQGYLTRTAAGRRSGHCMGLRHSASRGCEYGQGTAGVRPQPSIMRSLF